MDLDHFQESYFYCFFYIRRILISLILNSPGTGIMSFNFSEFN